VKSWAGLNWIAEDGINWRTVVNTVLKIRVP
jgi:hypothetical protein